MKRVLVTGAAGQIGSELTLELRSRYGGDNVIITDIRKPSEDLLNTGPFELLDVTDKNAIEKIVMKYDVNVIYHLAAILSAAGERNPQLAWNVNVNGLYNVLEVAREHGGIQIFWPSSIAVFGPEAPRINTPQNTILLPRTMYGITKVTGELLCNYYHLKYGVDVRSVRYPGIISSKTLPGGGTTDYAVEMFYEAIKHKHYTCYLKPDTTLPMMYMPDCINAAITIMEAEPSKIKCRTSYNLAAMSFSPAELATEIKKHIPEFTCEYKPDFRQNIADTWPKTIDDSEARKDWGWKPKYDLTSMTKDMIEKLTKRFMEGRL